MENKEYELVNFFDEYNVINWTALAKRINMNPTLLRQYVSGVKTPSNKQLKRVITGLKELAKELLLLEVIDNNSDSE